MLIFRSLRLAVLAMIPNILPTLVVPGTMGWLGIPLNLMTVDFNGYVAGHTG